MAMSNCKECGKAVSTEAKTCPKCGLPKPASKLKIKKKVRKKSSTAKKPFDMGKFFTRIFPVPVVLVFVWAVSHGANFAPFNTNFLIVVGFVFLLWVLINIFAPDFFG
jgi:uncharacterized membrane protein YvbJ